MLILLAGCAQTIHLHPISQQDIMHIDKGQTIEAPKDGWFMSDKYLKVVVKAKVMK